MKQIKFLVKKPTDVWYAFLLKKTLCLFLVVISVSAMIAQKDSWKTTVTKDVLIAG
jgi:hypothetical protein